MYIRVIEDTSTEAMFGRDPETYAGVDVEASVAQYLSALRDALEQEYPEATIVVEGCDGGHIPGRDTCVEVGTDLDDEIPAHDLRVVEAVVQDIREKLWQSFEWCVSL